jgi:plastocyanin
MRRILLLLATAAAFVVAGCGGSSSSGSSSSTGTGSSSGSSGAAQSGNVIQVSMQNIQFAPKSITAKVGQTVKWTNNDGVVHDVKATSGASFKSSLFGKGGSYETKLTKPGTIKYVCSIHPGMDGTITVTG